VRARRPGSAPAGDARRLPFVSGHRAHPGHLRKSLLTESYHLPTSASIHPVASPQMNTEPRDLDPRALTDVLERHWGVAARSIDYLPVGFGSHHWTAVGPGGGRWFVSADDLEAAHHGGQVPDDVFAALDRAFRTAAALRDGARLEFVLAPI